MTWVLGGLAVGLATWFVMWLKPWIDDHYEQGESGD
jgi:hypothetical protein